MGDGHPEQLDDGPPRPSDGSKAGDYYTTADGTKVYNEGDKKLDVCTLDWMRRRIMTFQLAWVETTLGFVRQTAQAGEWGQVARRFRGRDRSPHGKAGKTNRE